MRIKNIRHEINSLVFDAVFAILTLLVVVFFYKNILLMTILLGIITLSAFVKWRTLNVIIIFILGGFLGTLAEMIGVNFGVWNYSVANIWNVPSWLFVLWGNVAIFIYRLSNEIKKMKIKK